MRSRGVADRECLPKVGRPGARLVLQRAVEGEITVAMPRVRGALAALVIGACVRGLSDREIQSLAEEAGPGRVPRSTVSKLCREPRARHVAFSACDLAGVEPLAPFLGAAYLPTRPRGEKEGVLVARPAVGARGSVARRRTSALDDATGAEDAERRMRALVGELASEYPSSEACLADELPAL